jgi:uncharacterized membrane protein YdbT with pleckstrin-like domain
VNSQPGEQVFFHGHPSWRSILGFYIKGLVLAVVVGAIAGLVTRLSSRQVQVGWVTVGVLAVFVIVLLAGFVKRVQVTYTISDQRLTIRTGIFSRNLHETRIERVQNVNATQSLLERLLRVGTVDFDTASGTEYDFKFRGVADPQDIVRTVDQAIHQLRGQASPAV